MIFSKVIIILIVYVVGRIPLRRIPGPGIPDVIVCKDGIPAPLLGRELEAMKGQLCVLSTFS